LQTISGFLSGNVPLYILIGSA